MVLFPFGSEANSQCDLLKTFPDKRLVASKQFFPHMSLLDWSLG